MTVTKYDSPETMFQAVIERNSSRTSIKFVICLVVSGAILWSYTYHQIGASTVPLQFQSTVP